MQATALDDIVQIPDQDGRDRCGGEARYIALWLKASDQDVNVMRVAHAAIAEFGAAAVSAMQRRSDNHLRDGQQDGADFWRRVAKAARLVLAYG